MNQEQQLNKVIERDYLNDNKALTIDPKRFEIYKRDWLLYHFKGVGV